MTMQDVMDYIIPDKFGTGQVHEFKGKKVYVSNGILYAMEKAMQTNDFAWGLAFTNALGQYSRGDYGGFYEPGEEPVPGHSYFMCPTPFGKDVNNSIIIHEEGPNTLRMYFQFER